MVKEERMKAVLFVLVQVVTTSVQADDICLVGTSKFDGAEKNCTSLLDHCESQNKLVENNVCGKICPSNAYPDAYGEKCVDDSADLRDILMMQDILDILKYQLPDLRSKLDTPGLTQAIRDLEEVPSLGNLNDNDIEILTKALAKMSDVQSSDIILETYYKFFAARVNYRIGRLEEELDKIRDGEDRINSVLRQVINLYNEFVYKIKEVNDQIEKKRDDATEALAGIAIFDNLLEEAKKGNRKLDKPESPLLVLNLLQKNVVEVGNEYKRNGAEKAMNKVLRSLPKLIDIGYSIIRTMTSKNTEYKRKLIEEKIQTALKAVGSISSSFSSRNWDLIRISGSFLEVMEEARDIKEKGFGRRGANMNDGLISDLLVRYQEIRKESCISSSF